MKRIFAAALLASLLGTASAQSGNLVRNGDFEKVTDKSGNLMPGKDNYLINGSLGGKVGYDLTDWTSTNYVGVVYGEGVGDSSSHTPLYEPGHNPARLTSWYLRGSQDGLAGDKSFVLPASSPAGGNYFGSDGNFGNGVLTQTVTSFVVGQTYTLSFWYAGAELGTGGGESMTAGWDVTVGKGAKTDLKLSVTTPSYRSQSSTPWVLATATFVASSTDELLSFVAHGTGSPPMALLDGVSIVAAVPEPAEWMMLGAGLLLIGNRKLRNRKD